MVDRVYERNASDSAPQPPADPSTGYPTAGNPAQSVPATLPGAYWYHMITESLMRVVVEAGLTPDHEDLDQLLAAIRGLAATTTLKGTVEKATLTEALAGAEDKFPDAAGVLHALRNAAASTEKRGTVEKSTTDEAKSGAADKFPDSADVLKAINQYGVGAQQSSDETDAAQYQTGGLWLTPDTGHVGFPDGDNTRALLIVAGGSNFLAQIVMQQETGRMFYRTGRTSDIESGAVDWREIVSFSSSDQDLSSSGYRRHPGGLILQWFTTPLLAADTDTTCSYPISFPNDVLSVSIARRANGYGADQEKGINFQNETASQIDIWNTSPVQAIAHVFILGH